MARAHHRRVGTSIEIDLREAREVATRFDTILNRQEWAEK